MTLVSLISGYGYPVIISDRAVSTPGQLQKVVLPTTNRETLTETPVSEFNVKSLIVQDILSVSFVGNFTILEQGHSEILDFFMHRSVTIANLTELLDTHEFVKSKDCAWLFVLGGPEFSNNQTQVIRIGNWIHYDERHNLDVHSAGSGAREWTEHLIENITKIEETHPSVTLCKQRALLICMSFIARERANTNQLMDGWGGGFDVIYYEGGRFHRIDPVAYIFWVVNIKTIDKFTVVALIDNSYVNQNVIVRNLTIGEFKIHYIRQLNDRSINPENFPFCASRDAISCIHLIDDDGVIDDVVILYRNPDDTSPALYFTTFKDGKFGIQFDELYIKALKASIKSYTQ
ncbi:hypothetical protein INP83_11445 [Mucilaginibacter sp. 21P]|uniref:hypothetical protein n=1 Tax=Mucilaginibacter sp. 21P TaxID=2778902 RepID=UPI001C56709D|nr:hypothetical protein [Mucilaginibacter sp. 21P]QXV63723.1 hypothetical protein INP83_11445 [Mucilaginibacter sp. 21P]